MFFDKPKPKRKAISKAVKVTVWNKYIGVSNRVGQCYVCRKTIDITDFDVGHNKAKKEGGSDQISNLRPICRTCNLSMGTMSIEVFKAKHFGRARSRTKTAVVLDKVQTYLTKQGYEISSKKHGFDLVGEDKERVVHRYVVVGFNNERTVTNEYALKFKKKLVAYYKMSSAEYMLTKPHVEGLIAYTGIISKDAQATVKASKPIIKFRKL